MEGLEVESLPTCLRRLVILKIRDLQYCWNCLQVVLFVLIGASRFYASSPRAGLGLYWLQEHVNSSDMCLSVLLFSMGLLTIAIWTMVELEGGRTTVREVCRNTCPALTFKFHQIWWWNMNSQIYSSYQCCIPLNYQRYFEAFQSINLTLIDRAQTDSAWSIFKSGLNERSLAHSSWFTTSSLDYLQSSVQKSIVFTEIMHNKSWAYSKTIRHTINTERRKETQAVSFCLQWYMHRSIIFGGSASSSWRRLCTLFGLGTSSSCWDHV